MSKQLINKQIMQPHRNFVATSCSRSSRSFFALWDQYKIGIDGMKMVAKDSWMASLVRGWLFRWEKSLDAMVIALIGINDGSFISCNEYRASRVTVPTAGMGYFWREIVRWQRLIWRENDVTVSPSTRVCQSTVAAPSDRLWRHVHYAQDQEFSDICHRESVRYIAQSTSSMM